jgi:glycosyltransferase involved in cell wall biosynthesis
MPEIGGPNAILINPENPDEITDMMIKLETDNDFYSRQEEIGLHQAAMFSWRQTAENLLNLYEEVYKEL